MNSRDILKYAWNYLERNKKRAFLTFLGIMIGVSSIVSIRSLSNGFQQGMETQLADTFGANRITVTPEDNMQSQSTFNNTMVEDIQDIQHVERATGLLTIQGELKKLEDNKRVTLSVIGTDLITYEKINPSFEVGEGEIPENNGNILLLGYAVQYPSDNETFAEIDDEFNLTIWRRGRNYTIPLTLRGILKETSQIGPERRTDGTNKQVYIDLHLLQDTLSTEEVHTITCQVDNTENVNEVANAIRQRYEGVQVATSQMIISQINDTMKQFTTFLTAIGAIALIVAGFGVMNITLVSVSERTREIGILKSIGATKQSILGIFLAEALIIGIIGGVVGMVVGYGGAFVLGRLMVALMSGSGARTDGPMGDLMEMLVPILDSSTIITGFLIAVFVSLIFALWPAKRAADKKPVEALRFG